MSSSTALLPNNGRKDEHPIFLRVCHSPWIGINQKILVAVRGFVAVYMTLIFALLISYDVTKVGRGWITPFEFTNVIYLLQVMYAMITFSWTYMHLHYPHYGSAEPSYATRLQSIFSPPRQCHRTRNRITFSIFYTSVVVFPHVVTLVYWLILVPDEKTSPVDLFGHGWLRPFCIINEYGINSLIALVEVIILSSIKRQEPVWVHVIGLCTFCAIYIGWVYVGKVITGVFVYYFFDFQQNGWRNGLASVGAFIGLTNIFFAVIYGITGFREMLTKKSEDKSIGYTRLPQ